MHGRSLPEAWELVEYAWREFDHPRAADGKFGSGGGAAKGTSKPAAKKPAKKTPRKAAAKPAVSKPAAPKAGVAKKAPATPSTAPPPPAKDKAWLGEHYGAWRGSLTPGQRKALSGYQGADYGIMNAQLRSMGKNGVKDPSISDEEMARAARANRALNDAIKKAPPTTEPMTVHRTMTAAQAAALVPGSTMGDKGFVSTSLEPRKTSRGATVEVALPAGVKAAIGDGGEMILPASGRFRVLAVEEKDGRPHVRMEFVPYGSKAKTAPDGDAAAPEAPKAPAKAAPAATPQPAPEAPPAPKKPAPKAKASAAKTAPAAPPEDAPEAPTPLKVPAKAKTPAKPRAAKAPAAADTPSARTSGMIGAARHTEDADGVKWLASKMRPNMSRNEEATLRHYTGPGDAPINKALRNPNSPRAAQIQQQIDAIDAAMAKSAVPEDVIVHRGVAADYAERLGGKLSDPASMRAMVGKVVTEDSYLSTSAGQQAALQKEVQLMMRVPKGQQAINLMPISASPNERELLLDRGTNWVVHDVYESKGRWFIEVEGVPSGWKPGTNWGPSPAGDADAGYAHAVPDEEYIDDPDSEYYEYEG